MSIEFQILNKIEEMSMVLDLLTGAIVYVNDKMRDFLKQSGQTDYLAGQILKAADKEEVSIPIGDTTLHFRLLRQKGSRKEQLVAIEESRQIYENKGKKVASNLDALTGLPNKHYFIELTDEIMARVDEETRFAVVYFNIDKFQTFNDAYGFEVGDAFLKNVVKVLLAEFGTYPVARYSDDHFVVLTRKEGLLEKIERIHEKIHTFQRDVVMEIKAGIYELNDDTPISKASDRAKLACDSIKYNYQVDYRFYDASLREQLLKEKYIIDNIDKAVENQYLKVYYQPVVRVISGQLCGMESLVRWDDPKKGFLSPADFIPILEKHRLINKVDQYVIERVCQDFVHYKEEGIHQVPVSVNLSRLDFQLMDVCAVVNEIVDQYGIDKSLLHLEVTESALTEDSEQLSKVINQLKADGYEVWLDDFGSEYSTLNTLQNYQFNTLKIDMKFFATFQTNESARIIILSIVDMAKRLKMKTVAEGVETCEQVEFLRELGCDIVQGYYFFKPMPLKDVYALMQVVESPDERVYFDTLSKINLLSPEPIENTDVNYEMFFTAPTAIVQVKEGHISFLFVNKPYMECMESLDIDSLQEAERLINDQTAKINYRLSELVETCRKEKRAASVDYVYRGAHCNITIKEIASTKNASAYFTTLINMSGMNQTSKVSALNESLPFLYSIYNRVDLLDVTNDRIDNIYLNAVYYKSNLNGSGIREKINQFALQDIYEEDREKFVAFYDYATLKERIAKSKKGYVVQILRTRTKEEKIITQFYLIIQAGDTANERYLSCVRDMSMELAKDFVQNNSNLS